MTEKHLTTKQLAELMACSTATVLRMARKGEIPSTFWGGERRYPVAGIDAYIAKQRAKAMPPTARVIELRRA